MSNLFNKKNEKAQMVISFFIGELQQGGSERVVASLANYWVNIGFTVCIITVDSNDAFYNLDSKINVYNLCLAKNSEGNIFKGIYNNAKIILGLRNLLKSVQVNYLISFITDSNILALISTWGLDIKVIISDRTSPLAEVNFTHPLKLKLKKCVYQLADYLVVQTNGVAKYYESWFPIKKTIIINNPISIDFCSDFKNVGNKNNIILAVGRLQKEKNFELLINAVSQIRMNDWTLVIVGEGKERNNLINLIKKNKAENHITLAGSSSNIIDWYKQASIFVLTSKFEGFPNVLIEALAMGIPVISTDCDFGPSEIIQNGINGMLVANNDVSALSSQISNLMNNDGLRNELAKNGLNISKRLNIQKIAKEWESLF